MRARFPTFWGASAFLVVLTVLMIVLFSMLVRSLNEITVTRTEVLDSHFHPVQNIKSGDEIIVRRYYCLKDAHQLNLALSLTNRKTRVVYPLPGGPIKGKEGCAAYEAGIVVPDIDTGGYILEATLSYPSELFSFGQTSISPTLVKVIE